MAQTERSTACPECQKQGGDSSGDNLKWFRNGQGNLTNKCVKCGYRENEIFNTQNFNGQNTNNTAELITTGRYEAIMDRGISEEICRKFYVQVDKLHGKPVHIYNYFNARGNIIAQKVRFVDTKEFIWRGNQNDVIMFGQQTIGTAAKVVWICEGELDVLSIAQLGFSGVSIRTGAGNQTSSEIKNHLDYLEQFDKIILVFDNDDVGRKTALACAELFVPGKCHILTLRRYKDPNDYIKAGEEQSLFEELNTEGIKFEPDCIVTPELEDLLTQDKPRIRLPYPQLQEYVRGISKDEGELWLLGAGAKTGKSTFTKELIKGILDKDPEFKVGVCYTEESIKKAGQSFIAMDSDIPTQMYKENMSLIDKKKAKQSYDKYLKNRRIKFIDIQKMQLSSNKLMNVLRHMVVGGGYKFIILDHLSMFTYDMDSRAGERKDIDIFLRRINSLTKELNFTILCVCHLSRAGDGKDYSEGRAITMRDFRGSGSFEQLCDVMLALERNSLDEFEKSKVRLKVLANRITGNAGYIDELFYDQKTGRLRVVGELFK